MVHILDMKYYTLVNMASTHKNFLLKGLHGAIGKQIVVKQYGKKTVVTKYLDMRGIQPTDLQIIAGAFLKKLLYMHRAFFMIHRRKLCMSGR
jgi:hypothetical protein